ncbi:MAG: hypothetical protein ABJA78_09860 [Ferruginibacter sp.]
MKRNRFLSIVFIFVGLSVQAQLLVQTPADSSGMLDVQPVLPRVTIHLLNDRAAEIPPGPISQVFCRHGCS